MENNIILFASNEIQSITTNKEIIITDIEYSGLHKFKIGSLYFKENQINERFKNTVHYKKLNFIGGNDIAYFIHKNINLGILVMFNNRFIGYSSSEGFNRLIFDAEIESSSTKSKIICLTHMGSQRALYLDNKISEMLN